MELWDFFIFHFYGPDAIHIVNSYGLTAATFPPSRALTSRSKYSNKTLFIGVTIYLLNTQICGMHSQILFEING